MGAAAVLGGLGAGSSLLGGLFQSSAAKSAASTQAQASEYAANVGLNETSMAEDLIRSMYSQNQAALSPFITEGANAAGKLGGALGSLMQPYPALQPFQPTMEQLAQTPGYQFALGQGELATQNQFASQGLGGSQVGLGGGAKGSAPSGALGKGLASFAEGLASTTYNQQFQNYLQQQQQGFSQYLGQNAQLYNILAGATGIGAQAAGALAGAGTAAGGQGATAALQGAGIVGSNITAGGAASAAGQVGSANALSNALTGASGSATSATLLNSLGLLGTNSTALPTLLSGSNDLYSNAQLGDQITGAS